jgi:D-sedoheptulose 7-phosphate isomerase
MDHLQELINRYPALEPVKHSINSSFLLLKESFKNNKKLLIAGNGGSSSDSEHIVGELMKNFIKKRMLPDLFFVELKNVANDSAQYLYSHLQPGLPAICLSGNSSLNTAIINDTAGDIIFAQQVYIYGAEGDVFLAITTSGKSKNIYYAAVTAKAKKIKVIALTGNNGGIIKDIADVSIIVPEIETYKIQEFHLPIYHCLCLMLEDYFF